MVADALSRRYALISMLNARLMGFEQVKDQYANDGDIRSEDITMKFKKMKIDYCIRMNKYFHNK